MNRREDEAEQPSWEIGVGSGLKATQKYYYAAPVAMGPEDKALTTKDTKDHEGILEIFGFPS